MSEASPSRDLPERARTGAALTTAAHSLERSLARAVRWTIAGAVVSLPLLMVPQPAPSQLMTYTLAHLSALVVFGLLVVRDLVRFVDGTWFGWLGPMGRWLSSGVAMVALAVGVVALVTLPTSAALRLEPSLQFLQLLSALDIAWAAGATLVGVGWLAGRHWGHTAGLVIGVICVWSIWSYLDAVGFSPTGGWQVDGSALMRYVLPYDMAAALIAVVSLILGGRRGGENWATSRSSSKRSVEHRTR